MKKIISILLAAVMVMALLAGCGSKNSDKTNDNNTPNNNQTTELSGSVSTNGSTSMDKVIGALREQFMATTRTSPSPMIPPAPAQALRLPATAAPTSALPPAP